MPATYVRFSVRDIDNRLLELHGLKPEEYDITRGTVKLCLRCHTKNGPMSSFRNKCRLALDAKTALDAHRRIKRAKEVMEVLLGNSEYESRRFPYKMTSPHDSFILNRYVISP